MNAYVRYLVNCELCDAFVCGSHDEGARYIFVRSYSPSMNLIKEGKGRLLPWCFYCWLVNSSSKSPT